MIVLTEEIIYLLETIKILNEDWGTNQNEIHWLKMELARLIRYRKEEFENLHREG